MFVRLTSDSQLELKTNDFTQRLRYQRQLPTPLHREPLSLELDRQDQPDQQGNQILNPLVLVKRGQLDRQGYHLPDQLDHRAHKLPALEQLVSLQNSYLIYSFSFTNNRNRSEYTINWNDKIVKRNSFIATNNGSNNSRTQHNFWSAHYIGTFHNWNRCKHKINWYDTVVETNSFITTNNRSNYSRTKYNTTPIHYNK